MSISKKQEGFPSSWMFFYLPVIATTVHVRPFTCTCGTCLLWESVKSCTFEAIEKAFELTLQFNIKVNHCFPFHRNIDIPREVWQAVEDENKLRNFEEKVSIDFAGLQRGSRAGGCLIGKTMVSRQCQLPHPLAPLFDNASLFLTLTLLCSLLYENNNISKNYCFDSNVMLQNPSLTPRYKPPSIFAHCFDVRSSFESPRKVLSTEMGLQNY